MSQAILFGNFVLESLPRRPSWIDEFFEPVEVEFICELEDDNGDDDISFDPDEFEDDEDDEEFEDEDELDDEDDDDLDDTDADDDWDDE